MQLARRSDLLTLLLDRLYLDRVPSEREIDLFAMIVERAAALSKEKLGARFTVLYWDTDGQAIEPIFERLAATGVPIVRATSLVSMRELNSLRIPHDNHPTPEAYRRLAAGLAVHLGVASRKPLASDN